MNLQILPDDHVTGPSTASVTVVTYCDFECRYCVRAYWILKRFREQWRDHVRMVFRHFPLVDQHPLAYATAEVAEAAGAKGHFWDLHDLLFERTAALTKQTVRDSAEWLGLDIRLIDQALRDGTYTWRVDRDVKLGLQSGVSSPPAFFINGRRHANEDTLATTIHQALSDVRTDVTPR